jgi:hypothetical protein
MDDQTAPTLSLNVAVPHHLPVGIAQSLEEGILKAIEILESSPRLSELAVSADGVARLIASQVRPSRIMLEARVALFATLKEVFENDDWLTAEEINKLQLRPPARQSRPASDWERQGRIFSASYDGKKYFPRYQFDAMYRPLPVIRDVLKAYGQCSDPWSLAAWFYFPNAWIATNVGDESVAVAPRNALGRLGDVVNAARNQTNTYIA